MSLVYRLLGPHHNRLLTVTDNPDRKHGQIDHDTAGILMNHGWTHYQGTAKAAGGWITPGTDPALRPRPLKVS